MSCMVGFNSVAPNCVKKCLICYFSRDDSANSKTIELTKIKIFVYIVDNSFLSTVTLYVSFPYAVRYIIRQLYV